MYTGNNLITTSILLLHNPRNRPQMVPVTHSARCLVSTEE